MSDRSTAVLIAGGGLVGLSAAVLLAHHGVPCVLVERHAQHIAHPRLSGLSPRVMEVFGQVGVETDIRELDEFAGNGGAIVSADTLAGPELATNPDIGEPEDLGGVIASAGAICDQDQVEPVLRARATQLGADIRFATELVTFDHDDNQVSARVRDRASGVETTVQAGYLLACDGQGSTVREQLGIRRNGPGVLGHQLSVLFRADLRAALRGRHIRICLTEQPVAGANLHVRSQGRWGFGLPFAPGVDRIEDFTEQRCAELIREAVGLPDVEPDILDVRAWPIAAAVAESYQRGRVFLVGDAAHVMPPTGGFGGQCGILDAHNIAWKLAAVQHGSASPALLESYEPERRPVGRTACRTPSPGLPGSWAVARRPRPWIT